VVNLGQESLQHQTIVRIRGELVIWLSATTSAGDGFTSFGVGIGVVSADAFAIGVTAMPSPEGDPDWPGWMYYSRHGSLVDVTTETIGRGPLSAVRIPIDTKAMRKFRINEVVFGSVHMIGEIGTAVASFVMSTRQLVKLP